MINFNKKIGFLSLALIGAGILAAAVLFNGYSFNAPQDSVKPSVSAAPESEKIKVSVYFNNSRMDPEVSCNKVFPVEREIAKTSAPARAALEELFKGVDAAEREQGFFTSLNSGVKIQSLVIENGIARVDFNEQMEFQVGGSCRVSAIRAQITQTLKQFSSVESVVISINGRTEDILQP